MLNFSWFFNCLSLFLSVFSISFVLLLLLWKSFPTLVYNDILKFFFQKFKMLPVTFKSILHLEILFFTLKIKLFYSSVKKKNRVVWTVLAFLSHNIQYRLKLEYIFSMYWWIIILLSKSGSAFSILPFELHCGAAPSRVPSKRRFFVVSFLCWAIRSQFHFFPHWKLFSYKVLKENSFPAYI